MEIINYNQNNFNDSVLVLIKDLYKDYPLIVNSKIFNIKKSISVENPFFNHGQVKCFLIIDGGIPVAHLAAIIDQRLDKGIGLIGFVEMIDKQDIFDIAMKNVKKYFIDNGVTEIRGPIDLSTWQGFRLSGGDNEPFFSEPYTKNYYQALFENYGFKIAQKNISTLSSLEGTNFINFKYQYFKIIKDKYSIININKENYNKYEKMIKEILFNTFSETWSFVDITDEEFSYNFGDYIERIDTSFLLLVIDEKNTPVAFSFAIPDKFNNSRLIVKNLAVRPEYQGKDIGKALFYKLYENAKITNINEFIFSTMRDDNNRILEMTNFSQVYRIYKAYKISI